MNVFKENGTKPDFWAKMGPKSQISDFSRGEFGEISQHGRFWAKMAKFWSKHGQKVKFPPLFNGQRVTGRGNIPTKEIVRERGFAYGWEFFKCY